MPLPSEILDILNGLAKPRRKTWYVDTNTYGSGISWDSPFHTMAEAFNVLDDDQDILVRGDVREQLLMPLGVHGTRIIGATGGALRHDAGMRWREPASPTASTPLLTVREEGNEIHNILFVPGNGITGLRLRRAEDATYPDGGKTIVNYCKFIGSSVTGRTGIEDHGGTAMNEIRNCFFYTLADGIKNTSGAGIASPLRWLVEKCKFAENTNNIDLPGNECVIQDIVMGRSTTIMIDTGGGTAGLNFVLNVYVDDVVADVDNAHGYTGHASDCAWRIYANDQADPFITTPPGA